MSTAKNTAEMQLLRDQSIQPTDGVLAALLGEVYPTYAKFIDMLNGFGITPQWRYYNDGKAWLGKGLYKWKSAKGKDNEKTVFWLSLWDGYFKVSFFFNEKTREGLQNLALGAKTKKMVENAAQMGKLNFFPLVFDIRLEIPEDFTVLIAYKKSLK